MFRWLWLVLFFMMGCEVQPPPAPRPPRLGQLPTLEKFECQRCHSDLQNVGHFPLIQSCTGCHQAILAGRLDATFDLAPQWKTMVKHLVDVPSLQGVDQRLRRDWFVSFIQNPHDIRPALPEMMPRLKVSAAEAEQLADELGLSNDSAEPALGDAERGKTLYVEKACGACHVFSGAAVPVLGPGLPAAPDLRWARERVRRDTLQKWLDDPCAMKSNAVMPDLLTAEQAKDVAAFLLETPLSPTQRGAAPTFLPPLERAVPFREVSDRVFSKICVHCHSRGIDTFPPGDGGPGGTGGFGFAPRTIDFTTEDAAKRVAGRIGRHLRARHLETWGQVDPEVRGMPLGLPPLPLEDIQLIEAWAAHAQ